MFELLALESILEEGFSTAVKKPSRLSDTCFTVLIQNVGINTVFKPVAINLYSSSLFISFSSVSVGYFWSRTNSFHLTTFLNCLITVSMLT